MQIEFRESLEERLRISPSAAHAMIASQPEDE